MVNFFSNVWPGADPRDWGRLGYLPP